ncbi:Sir2 silent information regulator family NAD-dependent deacetylase [Paenibacillus sp. ACRSA]|uniref:Sir2 silent information regulator family NAD-dependent deacetylase n=1 Tax=Paenibacillus sp. ACRSA TaxID=2918211 RepID=UPI001EF72B97|nr:Sir2 silent information regulator family NAD-dependent deacetylase [Paenibacillus sp. ACRSA]MCG7376425.1 Sir2 silent information regulator family NAD-dependent deacetylase [Paenibacillus sp. ACRSA]
MNTNYQQRIDLAKAAMQEADYILLGGGAGLSAAAGITFNGKRFTDHFGDFIDKYGFTDLYSSGFYPFETQEDKWAYWARHIQLNRYDTGTTQLYLDLYELVKNKKHFVISTNVESQFEKAGFASSSIFEIQGNYGYLQCEKGCHDTLYDNEELVKKMVEQTVDCKIPTNLVPKCPVCGGSMDVNLRINEYFVQDEQWHMSERMYRSFIQDSENQNVVYMELGVGFNTPGIIRYPFERMTYHNELATLIRFNQAEPAGLAENQHKTIAFTEDMNQVFQLIRT